MLWLLIDMKLTLLCYNASTTFVKILMCALRGCKSANVVITVFWRNCARCSHIIARMKVLSKMLVSNCYHHHHIHLSWLHTTVTTICSAIL